MTKDDEVRRSFVIRLHSFDAQYQRNLLRIETDDEIEKLKSIALEIAHFEVAYVLVQELKRRGKERPVSLMKNTQDNPAEAAFYMGWLALASEIYQTGRAAGFYDTPATDPKFNHSEKMMLVVTELAEAVEGLRGAPFPGIMDDKLTDRPMVEAELADAVIRIMNYGSHCGLDIASAIIAKNNFNKTREHRHGGKRF